MKISDINKSKIKVSIIMGIYNCESTLEETILSILNQTYKNWELIMCDDGSVDNTYDIAKKYNMMFPEKIVLLSNARNMGLGHSLNKCLDVSIGEYIARIDADDVAVENRLEKQVEFLDNNKKYALVGTAYTLFDEYGEWGKIKLPLFPTKYDVIKGFAFAHPTVMIRANVIKSLQGYTVIKETRRSEDYDLWCKLYFNGYIGCNFEESLHLYREDRDSISNRKLIYRWYTYKLSAKWIHKMNLNKKYYLLMFKIVLKGFVPKMFYRIIRKLKYKIE